MKLRMEEARDEHMRFSEGTCGGVHSLTLTVVKNERRSQLGRKKKKNMAYLKSVM
jgi:hypothetical protein